MAQKAVFLDRDNTIIEDPGYLADPNAVRLLPGVELALKSLSQAGYKLVVVTNQSGVARGMVTEETVEKIHAEMRRQLAAGNVHLDAVYYCPYHPEGTVERYAKESELRKPQPGMLLKAVQDLGIDLASSWIVGDSGRDVEAGQRAGCRTIRLPGRETPGPDEAGSEDLQGDFSARNLVEAAKRILREDVQRSAGAAQPPPGAREAPRPAPARTQPAAQKTEGASAAGIAAVAAQALAVVVLVLGIWNALSGGEATSRLVFWALAALTLQVMALTFYVTRRPR